MNTQKIGLYCGLSTVALAAVFGAVPVSALPTALSHARPAARVLDHPSAAAVDRYHEHQRYLKTHPEAREEVARYNAHQRYLRTHPAAAEAVARYNAHHRYLKTHPEAAQAAREWTLRHRAFEKQKRDHHGHY